MRKELRLPSWMPPSPPSTTTSKPSAALALGRSGRNANAASKAREGLTYFHLCERSNVILVSGYLGFAARREGASLVHASLLALLSAAVLQALVAGGTVWLSGTPLTHVIEPTITAWALACAAALSGALAAGLYPIREPFARWHAWDAAA